MSHAYWGPGFGDDALAAFAQSRQADLAAQDCSVETIADDAKLISVVAEGVAVGQVVGWFQGRMEWGPRALGNRSILGDPRRADMKEILNLKIKRRESFRPFAPSVLREAVPEWFESDDDVTFMMQAFRIRHGKRPAHRALSNVRA